MTKSHFEEKQSFSRDTVFLTQPEVSEWLKISKSTLYRWVQEGAFPKPVVLGKPEKNGTSISTDAKCSSNRWHIKMGRE